MGHFGSATLTISEMREFASFTSCEQRYIRRSLDIGFRRHDPFALWARDACEGASIRGQREAYADIEQLRRLRPDDVGFEDLGLFVGKLVQMAVYDLAQEKLDCFSAFRFLYERLLGAWVRPWLPGAFCGAAALPQVRPDRRKVLLHSISEAAATAPGWSDREPSFFPEFIELEAAA